MIDLILHTIIFITWLAYTFPPLAFSKTKKGEITRMVLGFLLSLCIGASMGIAFSEVIKDLI